VKYLRKSYLALTHSYFQLNTIMRASIQRLNTLRDRSGIRSVEIWHEQYLQLRL